MTDVAQRLIKAYATALAVEAVLARGDAALSSEFYAIRTRNRRVLSTAHATRNSPLSSFFGLQRSALVAGPGCTYCGGRTTSVDHMVAAL